MKCWLLWIGFRPLSYAPDVQQRGEAVTGLKGSKVDSQKHKHECTSMDFTCCVLGHRSFIIIELLKYRSLLHIVHDYVFKALITPNGYYYFF